MKKEDLIALKKKISKLSNEELKNRDLYLRQLSNGELQGPLTGYASIDKPWLKYYSKEQIFSTVNHNSVAETMNQSAKNNPTLTSSQYICVKRTFEDDIETGDKLAKALKAFGVKKGDIVTVSIPCIPEYRYLFYAINKIGAISNWLDFRTGEAELIECLDKVENNCNLAFIFDGVCDKVENAIEKHNAKSLNKITSVINIKPSHTLSGSFVSNALKFKESISDKKNKKSSIDSIKLNYDKFLRYSEIIDDFECEKMEPNSTAAIVYTGGTTGTPKGVELTNENFNALVDGYKNSSIDFSIGDSFLQFLPPWTAYGLAIDYVVFNLGLSSIYIPKLDPASYDKLILKEKPNHTTGIPKNLDILINSKNIKKNTDLSFFKTAAVGADSMNINREIDTNKFFEQHNSSSKTVKGYGMTEGCATICTTSNSINKLGSVGIPFVHNNICIVEPETGVEVSYVKKGEICYCGNSVMKRYYKNLEETDKVLRKHEDGNTWMHSGDIGYIDNDGYLYIVGRIKRMFVRSGFKLFSSVIEDVVGSHYAVRNCVAVGINDQVEGSIPVVNIILKDEYIDCSEEIKNKIMKEIDKICSENLFEYYLPLKYIFTEKIPYTKNGKVDFIQVTSDSEKIINTPQKKLLKK